MNKKILSLCLLFSLFLSACGPGQLFGPTITPSPTATLTPTPTSTPTLTPSPTLTPIPTSTFTLTPAPVCEEAGCSFENPIVITASNEFAGIALEYQWLDEHYPGYENQGQYVTSHDGKMYDVFNIVTADGEAKTIYFDITSFFGKF